jgi:hypothetical protein
MADDDIGSTSAELLELSDKIQLYFTAAINFFDKTTAYVTYAAIAFSAVSVLLLYALSR